jgi:hypothetical protein
MKLVPGGTVRRVLLLCAGGVAITCAPLRGQDPIPTDTVPVGRDTIVVPIPPEQVAPDTIPVETEPDTIAPAPRLPGVPREPAAGWNAAEWEWGQEELERWHGLTILDLVEQIPGLLVTRAGWYGQPAGAAAFGQGGGRLRVVLDGYELDPLASATFDLQHISVADLQGIRVRRGLLETIIELRTFRLTEARPFSQIEASTGLYGTRYIRGLFSTIAGDQGMVTLGLDVTDTSGWLGQQPFSNNGLMARWSRLFGTGSGLELEFRQTSLSRPMGSAFPLDGQRRDVVMRGRHRLTPQLHLEADLGQSRRTNAVDDTLGTQQSAFQAHLRAHFDNSAGWISGSARMRDGGEDRYSLPRLDLQIEGGYRLGELLRASAAIRRVSVTGVSGTEAEARVETGRFAGFGAFAEVAAGSRALGVVRDTIVQVPMEEPGGDPIVADEARYLFSAVGSDAGGVRTGGDWQWMGARIGVALLRHQGSLIVPFGFRFDRRIAAVHTQPITGYEISAAIPVFTPALRLEGSHTAWSDVGNRPYLPVRYSRGSIEFSRQFYEGNFEPTLRLEGHRRGASISPGATGTEFDGVTTPYTWTSLFLQIRVLDVRLFLVLENLLNDRLAADIPGQIRGGARSYYGVRWHFLD